MMARIRAGRWLVLVLACAGLIGAASVAAQTLAPPTPTELPAGANAVLVFEGITAEGNLDIFIQTIAGVRNLTQSAANDKGAVVSEDGTKVAFLTQTHENVWTLFVINVDGTGLTQITPNGVNVYGYALSPRGEIVISAGWSVPQPQLFISLDGSPTLYTLTPAGNVAFNPVWAGEQAADIYFVYIPQGEATSHIATVSPHGGEIQQLTSDTTQKIGLSVSPEGQRLYFSARENETAPTGIFVMGADGSDQIRLTDDTFNTCCAREMPNGNVIYLGDESETTDVFLMNADGTNRINLTAESGNDFYRIQPLESGEALVAFHEGETDRFGVLKEDGNLVIIGDGTNPHVFGEGLALLVSQ